jgi:hypothetical protein
MKFDVWFHGSKNGIGRPLPGFAIIEAENEAEVKSKIEKEFTNTSHWLIRERLNENEKQHD